MSIAPLLLALTSVLANDRVAVFDGEDAGTRPHDAVVVDLKSASARFVRQGQPLGASGRSIIVELLAPPVGPLPNTTSLPDAFDRPGTNPGRGFRSLPRPGRGRGTFSKREDEQGYPTR